MKVKSYRRTNVTENITTVICLDMQWQSAGKRKRIKQQLHIEEKDSQHTEVNTELEGTPGVILGVADQKVISERKLKCAQCM